MRVDDVVRRTRALAPFLRLDAAIFSVRSGTTTAGSIALNSSRKVPQPAWSWLVGWLVSIVFSNAPAGEELANLVRVRVIGLGLGLALTLRAKTN